MRAFKLSALVLAVSLSCGGAWAETPKKGAAEPAKKGAVAPAKQGAAEPAKQGAVAPVKQIKPEETLRLDTKESIIKWTGKKVTGQHSGRVWLKGGEVLLKGGFLAAGSFEADMKSIKVDDLKDPDTNAKLTGHLNSADFFDTGKHPTATFKTTRVIPRLDAPAGQPTHDVTGDLTIKGITQPVSFPVRVEQKDGRASAKGTMTVDRTLYDIKYGSGKFFQGLGDKLIYDEFTLDLELVAK